MTWGEKKEEFIHWVDDRIEGLSVSQAVLLNDKLDELYEWIKNERPDHSD